MSLKFKKIPALVTAMLLAGCCVEGYIVPSTADISLSDAPPRVRKAIIAGHEAGEIGSVERTSFHSRCAQSWERYRFHLKGGQTVTLDEYGRLAKWRDGIRMPTTKQGT